jgi:hypothetical protein
LESALDKLQNEHKITNIWIPLEICDEGNSTKPEKKSKFSSLKKFKKKPIFPKLIPVLSPHFKV